jgi:2-dehydro-3-deoxyphosphooctonate aldolase (KDO 8-P synthase)
MSLMTARLNEIENIHFTETGNFFLLAGPCVVESYENLQLIAEHMLELSHTLQLPYVFKASYRKANRSRLDSFTGLGDEKSLSLLSRLKSEYKLPVITDIHAQDEAAIASEVADILQIPAFLCRQTDLLVAAGNTGCWVNIKKGQFLSAHAMSFAVDKVRSTGNDRVMLTERGTTFGYQDLVVDFRGIPVMKKTGCPVVMDITHSLQQPNQTAGVTGGKPEMIETIARAAIATGVDGLFIETHPDPSKALSDGANMLKLDLMEGLLRRLIKIKRIIGEFPDN